MNITRGKLPCAKKICVYGTEGIGKSTLASQFPDPLFIDTEGSTSSMDVARLDKPSSWQYLLQEVRYVRDNRPCKTLVIDTMDWAERIAIDELCSKRNWSGLEDAGYGRGYVYLAEEIGKFLNLLAEVTEAGIHVVLTAHAQMRKFEQPDELGAYDRWELKLSKKVAPMVKEWADMVLFCNYKTYVVNVDGQGAQKGKNKAQGGKRVIYTSHHTCWDAKNREGLPAEMEMSFASIAHLFTSVAPAPVPTPTPAPAPSPTPTKEEKPKKAEEPKKTEEPKKAPVDGVPKALADLMKEAGFTVEDVQIAVESRGYYPKGTPIANYDPAFVQGVLVSAWPQVAEMIRNRKKQIGEFINVTDEDLKDLMPFN